jgi:hypothetical protein
MKQDELSARLSAGLDFYGEHKNRIWLAVAVSTGLIAVGLGVFFYVRSQQNQAGAAFAQALNTYHAPVLQTPPDIPNLESYKTDDEKNEAALAAFNSVAEEYSWYAAGKLARYYAAICQRDLGNQEAAEQEFEDLARSADAKLAPLAKIGLAGIYQATGRATEADSIYKELQENPTESVPAVTAIIARADLYRQTNPSEASALYQQVARDYGGTPAGDYAEQMLAQLPR